MVMNPVGSRPVEAYTSAQKQTANPNAAKESAPAPLQVEQNKVTLSEEGKALLSALQELDKESKKVEAENKTVGDKVESFTYGALGMDHPDKIKEEDDGSYSAGQYLSAAATIGGLLMILV
ncbi:TPA: hypothetical protein I7162_11495 [Vibrio vulnificus]|nr:hypothetical protein [Vibrio vulnificus]